MIHQELPPFPLKNDVNGVPVARFSAEYVDIRRILLGIEPLAKTMKEFFNHPGGGYSIIMKNETREKTVRYRNRN